MIKLSDVKVRPQYRTRVRYCLLVLGYAWQPGQRSRAGTMESVPGRFGGGGSAGVAVASRGWCRPILGTGRGGSRPRPSS